MLSQLYIENIAVIQKAAIELSAGFNVFTGETGAGKTILISAIDAVLGERTTRDIIRAGEERALVCALFEDLPPHALKKLEELGYSDDEGALLVTREISQSGKSACKINGMPATAQILREISSLLIHIHGQRDSGQLLVTERHIEILDAFGEVEDELLQYGAVYAELQKVKAELADLDMDDAQKAQRMDMLAFQISEIEGAKLEDEGEEDELSERRRVIRNSERILEGLSAAYAALNGSDEGDGIVSLMDTLCAGINEAAQFVGQFEEMCGKIREMSYELSDYTSEIRGYLEEFEYSPQELNEIEYRLDLIYKLKRKYGGSIAEILEFLENAGNELDSIQQSDSKKAALSEKLDKLVIKAKKLGEALSKKRMKAAEQFTKRIQEELTFLDMPSVQLSIRREEKPFAKDGVDNIEFMIVTNVGELPKPLSKIASGGEMARMMLAIKNVLADRDSIGTLIFDEVDTGVSGRAAQKIGRKLRQVSRSRQVIAVTHLAQVAAFADTHMRISKEVDAGRTFTKVDRLEKDEVIQEIARITSGDMVTELALQNAAELLLFSQDGK